MPSPPLTLENVLIQVRDFLVVWMTQIVYHNRIYPEYAFEERTFLDLVIIQSRVPPLSDYFRAFANDIVSALVTKEGGGKVHDVMVVVYDESSLHTHKRYVINFGLFVGFAGQISTTDFLDKPTEVHQARITLPNFNWNEIYASLRSLMFFHVEELKRTHEHADRGLFFKLLLNTDSSVDLSGEQGQWIKLTSEGDPRKTKLVLLCEISTGFLCFDLHNEYIL